MTNLKSFENPIDVLVAGANGGIGRALVKLLLEDTNVRNVHALSSKATTVNHDKLTTYVLDVGNESELESALANINRLTMVIVAIGMLHNSKGLSPEKSYKHLSPVDMMESLYVNTVLPAIIAKHVMVKIPGKERAIFCALSARIGSISDNRIGGWYSYRAGKSALNQIIKCLSIEARRTHSQTACVGLHPGTVDTWLSSPFQKSMAPNHKLFSPETAARYLLNVINHIKLEDSGSLYAWDGTIIPP